MGNALDWLPPDDTAVRVSRWSDAKLCLLLADLTLLGVACDVAGEGWLTALALGVGLALLWRVGRTSARVDRGGFVVRGLLHSWQVPWSEVLTVEVVDGPTWLAVVMRVPRRARLRSSRRRSSTTVLWLRNGDALKPLTLMYALPSRGADRVSRLAVQLAEERWQPLT